MNMKDGGAAGFLVLKCGACGDERAFYARENIDTYRCWKCGGRTPLGTLVAAKLVCECGNRGHYRTNLDEPIIDVPCMRCGSPVALEYRRGRYQPVGDGEKRPKIKKKLPGR